VPAPLTSFIGREHELRDLESALAAHRLVTVLGPGGCGKTRVAVELTRRLESRFGAGAVLVELSQVDEPALVPIAIATALGIPDSADQTMSAALSTALRHRHLLLVLDNCEHVLGEAADVCEELLRSCDDVKILATSRQALGVSGELQVLLQPLATPPIGPDPTRLATFDGAALFIDRARLVNPAFTAGGPEAGTVADIVRRLDDAPLAIELAAAQLDVMSTSTLAQRLADRLDVLVNPGRAATARQASLDACIEWSYGRLDPAEQRAFRALSVFPGRSPPPRRPP
jgi:predicted ATPase